MPGLERDHLDADPVVQFGRWFEAARAAGEVEPEAMTLATATPGGRPSARMVLLKGVDERGFVFYTNYRSRKGRELAANPWAALVFRWATLGRSVRVEGPAAPVSAAESDLYFAGRPPGSRIGAWASPQSEVIGSRSALEARAAAVAAEQGAEPPRPEHWGGFRVVPDSVEFWQHRPDRLHDRFRYRRQAIGWIIERLAP